MEGVGVDRTIIAIDARRTQWHPHTGIPRYVRGLCEAICLLDPRDLEIVALVDRRFPIPGWLSELPIRKIPTNWKGSAFRQLVWDMLTLRRLLRSEGIDLYHMPWFDRPPSRGVLTVVTLHDLNLVWAKPRQRTRYERVYSEFAGRCLERADGLLFISQTGRTEAEVLSGGLHQPWRVTPVGWPTLHPEDPPGPQFRPSIRDMRETSAFRVLVLGGVDPRKNSARLACELDLLSRNVKNLEVVTTGSGWSELLRDRAWHTAYATVNDADLENLMKSSTCLVIPSRWEGQCLPVLEAISCNLPVVCTDLPAVRESTPPGVVYVRESSKVGSYSDAIRRAVECHAGTPITDVERTQYLSSFSWSNLGTSTLELYREVLASSRSTARIRPSAA